MFFLKRIEAILKRIEEDTLFYKDRLKAKDKEISDLRSACLESQLAPKQDSGRIVKELEDRLAQVLNKSIPADMIQVPAGKKFISLTDYSKKNKIIGGLMLNIVVTVPDGFEIDKVVLKRNGGVGT